PTIDLFGSKKPDEQAELQWRLSMPLMALVLSIVAVPLARVKPRQGRYPRGGLAILIYFVYSLLLRVPKAWVTHGQLSSTVGLWWVHALIAVLVLLLLYRNALWRTLTWWRRS